MLFKFEDIVDAYLWRSFHFVQTVDSALWLQIDNNAEPRLLPLVEELIFVLQDMPDYELGFSLLDTSQPSRRVINRHPLCITVVSHPTWRQKYVDSVAEALIHAAFNPLAAVHNVCVNIGWAVFEDIQQNW